ncbi:hypothetical protein HanIR_Chr02g0061301 [Helianthus annuus]|nr:hypothetical protein HanIR_Chr02g0061301 [Helianthus annuus]
MQEDDKKMYEAEKRALAAIKTSLPDSIKHTFKRYTNSKDMWDALEKRYQGNEDVKRNKAVISTAREGSNDCSVHLEDNESATQAFMAEIVPVDEAETTVSDAESEVKNAEAKVDA